MNDLKLRFLCAQGGNAFLRELPEALAASVSALGVESWTATSPAPDLGDDVVDIVVPHEYFGRNPELLWPEPRRRRRTLALITEHPGTPWFESSCMMAAELGASVALNRSAAVTAKGRGLHVSHLQLGYVPAWDQWGGEDRDRPVDVTYLGFNEGRRNRMLAGYSDDLWRWNAVLLIPPHQATASPQDDFIVGTEKWRHLASSKVIINLHREHVTDTEWPRFVEAICNGAVVVSEHCSDSLPLQPGTHYISAAAEHLGEVADSLLRDPLRLAAIRTQAYDLVRESMPADVAATRLVETCERMLRPRLRFASLLPPVNPTTVLQPLVDWAPRPRRSDPVHAILKQLSIEVQEARRDHQRLEAQLLARRDPDGVETVHTSPSHADATPRVSVVMPLYNHEVEVLHALESLVASDGADFEVVIVDDASSDRSVSAVTAFLKQRPEVPALLSTAAVNHGPAWSRNRCIERARGELLFFLDSDNAVYPPTLRLLTSALDDQPDAALAYPMIAIHGPDGPEMLISQHAWNPRHFRDFNPIDTMAMVRRSVVEDAGGFSEDPRLQGLEDWDLWCRVADRGLRGISVPNLLGWYRRAAHSVLTVADLDHTVALSLMARRAPSLFGDERL